jgi:PAS domain S-box-containing protein
MAANQDKLDQLKIDWKASSEHIIKNADEGIAFFNPQLELVFWNPNIEKFTGKKGNELEGKKLSDILPAITSVELTNQIISKKENVNTLDEDLEVMVIPYYNDKNQLTGGVAIFKDHHAFDEKDYHADFKSIFESLPGMYVILSPNLEILAASNSYLKSTYTIREKIQNKFIFDILCQHDTHSPKSIEKLKESFNYVLENRVSHEIPVERFDVFKGKELGCEEHYWSISTIPVLNENAEVTCLIVNAADVTIQHKGFKEVKENKHRFELLAASLNVVVWEYDFINGQVWWNDNFYKQFKYNNSSQETDIEHWENALHPKDRERVVKSLKKAIDSGEKKWSAEYRFKRGDGTYAFVRDTGYTLLDKSGRPSVLIGTIVDLSSNKETENKIKLMAERFLRRNQELKKANETLDTFVYAAAHDLKSPVNNLKSLLELLQRTTDEQQKQIFIDAIGSSVQRLDKTIKSLTEIVEVQNKSDVSVKEVNLPELLDRILADYESDIKSQEIDVITDLKNERAFYYNEAFLGSILMNLLSNAIKYQSSKRRLTIKISSIIEDGYLVLEIQDNGIGIDLEKNKENLFKPFKRFTQQQEGKGIGLHLIKSIVEKNGGKIKVESELDKGSTFTVYLREYERDSDEPNV